MNVATLALNDLRLLWRYGFAAAYLVVAVLFSALLSALPWAWADVVLPVLAWSDPAFFCFFFAGASLCLDLSQGTLRALFASPLRPAVYLVVKAVNLGLLSFAMVVLMSASARGVDFRLWPLAASALAGGAPAAVLGAALALRLKTVNRFMMGSMPAFLLLSLPLVEYAAGHYVPPWFAVVARAMPTEGALIFARHAYTAVSGTELALAGVSAIVWTVVASLLFLGPAIVARRAD